MPRERRSNIGRRTRHSRVVSTNRRLQSEEDRNQQNASQRERNRRINQSVDSSNTVESARSINRRTRPSNEIMRQMEMAAYNYDSTTDDSMYSYIGQINKQCIHCKAVKFINGTSGMCCAGGKVKLPVLKPPPDLLHS